MANLHSNFEFLRNRSVPTLLILVLLSCYTFSNLANAGLIRSRVDQNNVPQTCLDLSQFEMKWIVDEETEGKFQLKTKEQKNGNVVQQLFTANANITMNETFKSPKENWEVVITKLILENMVSGNQKIGISFTMQHIKKPSGHDNDPEKGGIWSIDPMNIFTVNPNDPGGGSPSNLINAKAGSRPHTKVMPGGHEDEFKADIVGTPFSSVDATKFKSFVFESEGKHRAVSEPNALYLMLCGIFILILRSTSINRRRKA